MGFVRVCTLMLMCWASLAAASAANLTATTFEALTKRTVCAGALPESAHPYGNFLDARWTNTCPGARALQITFDSRTQLEWLYDYVYVTDAFGTNVQGSPFTGSDLAGKKLIVPGDRVIIRLDSDGAISDWGFAVATLVALEPEPAPTLVSRKPVTVFWQVHHDGLDLAGEPWMDTVFLSTRPSWNTNAIALKFRFPSEAHATADTYSQWVTIDTPIASAGDYFLLLNVDGEHRLEETVESDNERAIPLRIENIDLAAVAFSAPTFAGPQQPISISWTVTNLSSQTALPFWYDLVFYSSNSACRVVRNLPLPAHESYRVTYDYLLPSLPAGTRELQLRVNDSLMAEANPSNNVLEVSISIVPPDLVASAASAPGTVIAGEWFSASLVVSNRGSLAAYPSWTDAVYLSATNRWTPEALRVGEAGRWEAVAPGTQYAEQFALNLPAVGADDLFLLFVADAQNNLFDVDTNNNVVALPIHVQAADLVPITFFAEESLIVAPHERMTLTWLVANLGSGIAGQGWLDRVLLTTDPDGSNVVAELGSFWHADPVTDVDYYERTASVLIPRVAAGEYLLMLKTDSENFQAEADEANNVIFLPLTITAADLALESIAAPPVVAPQQSFPVSWTVRNRGPSTAYPPWDDLAYIAGTNDLFLERDFLLQLTSIQSLAPGAAYTQTQTVRLSSLLPGDYWLVLNTDLSSSAAVDTNNIAAIPIRVRAPDLAALAMTAPAGGLLQSNAQASLLVSNCGPVTAFEPWDVQFYISEMNRWVPSAIYLGSTQAHVNLAPGSSVWLTAPLQFNGPIAGHQFLIGRIDKVRLSDTNSRNNELSMPISIQSADLTAESFGVLEPVGTCPGPFSQSPHPYPETYLLVTNHSCPGADGLKVFFDPRSDTGLDRIEIMDGGRQPIPGSPFTGSELAAAQSVIVPGGTVVIHFAATHGSSLWGLGITRIDTLRAATNIVAAAQQNLDFQWMIRNSGNGPTLRPWDDTIALIATRGFPSVSEMVNAAAEKPLLAGDWYWQRMMGSLPPVKPGLYDVVLQADSGYALEEESKDNNTRSIQVEIISPDLAVVDLQGPALVDGQSTFQVTWRVQNVSAVQAFPDWTDRLYVSRTNHVSADATEISWQPYYTSLATNGSYAVTQFVTLPALNGGNYYLIARTDADSALFDSAIENNELAIPIAIQRPDLTPTQFLPVAPGALMAVPPQSTVNLSYTVQNLGPARAVSGWYDQIYLSQDAILDAQDVPLAHDLAGPAQLSVGAGYTRTVTIQIPPSSAGDYFLIFQANSGADLSEIDFSNNMRTLPIRLAAVDLDVTTFTAGNVAAPKQTIAVAWSVRNNGPAAVFPAWYDSFYLSSSPDWNPNAIFVSTSWRNDNVPAGSGYTGVTSLILPNVAPGDYYLVARADSENNLSDANPANNVRAAPLRIILPDLVPLSFSGASIGNLFASPQGEIDVHWTTTNAGPGLAAPQWVDRFYLSTNSSLDGSEILLDQYYVGQPLAAGAVYQGTATLHMGAIPAGQYRLLLEVDGGHSLRELSETNNVIAVPITIGQPADLSAFSLAAPASVEAHQHFAAVGLTWTVTNQGVASATTYWVDDIYLSRDQQLDSSDTAVGSFPRLRTLAPGNAYTATQNVVLPIIAGGRYYLLLVVDGHSACPGGCVYEMTETNNVIAVPIDINLVMPDLVIKQFNVPRYVASSLDSPAVQLGWVVRNEGLSTIAGSWTDNLYIDGRRVFSVFRDGPLAPGASYTNTFVEYLSLPASDVYFATIRIDDPVDCNCVSELSEDNNSSSAVFALTRSPGEIVLAGEASSIRLLLNSETRVAAVDVDVFVDPSKIVNVNPLYGLPATDLGGGWHHVELVTAGAEQSGWQQETSPLQFQALPNQRSCFVALSVSNIVAHDSTGALIPDVDAQGARLVVLGREPLLEITPLSPTRHLLTMYGFPGTNIFLETKISFISGPWAPLWNGIMTNRFQHAGPYSSPNSIRFYRARY